MSKRKISPLTIVAEFQLPAVTLNSVTISPGQTGCVQVAMTKSFREVFFETGLCCRKAKVQEQFYRIHRLREETQKRKVLRQLGLDGIESRPSWGHFWMMLKAREDGTSFMDDYNNPNRPNLFFFPDDNGKLWTVNAFRMAEGWLLHAIPDITQDCAEGGQFVVCALLISSPLFRKR